MVDSKPGMRSLGSQSAINHYEINNSSVLAQSLIERVSGLLGGGASFRNLPLYLAGTDFVLRDAAGLARIRVDHRRRARLELPRPPRRHQDVSIVAVQAFDPLYWDSPLKPGSSLITAEHRTMRSPEHGQLSGCLALFYPLAPTPVPGSLSSV